MGIALIVEQSSPDPTNGGTPSARSWANRPRDRRLRPVHACRDRITASARVEAEAAPLLASPPANGVVVLLGGYVIMLALGPQWLRLLRKTDLIVAMDIVVITLVVFCGLYRGRPRKLSA